MGEVLRALEGPLAPMVCASEDPAHAGICGRTGFCTVNLLWVKVRDALSTRARLDHPGRPDASPRDGASLTTPAPAPTRSPRRPSRTDADASLDRPPTASPGA